MSKYRIWTFNEGYYGVKSEFRVSADVQHSVLHHLGDKEMGSTSKMEHDTLIDALKGIYRNNNEQLALLALFTNSVISVDLIDDVISGLENMLGEYHSFFKANEKTLQRVLEILKWIKPYKAITVFSLITGYEEDSLENALERSSIGSVPTLKDYTPPIIKDFYIKDGNVIKVLDHMNWIHFMDACE